MDVQLTIPEAAAILNPPITERQLRAIITTLAIPPVGARYEGRRGRPHPTYHWADLARLHAALTPFLKGHDEHSSHQRAG